MRTAQFDAMAKWVLGECSGCTGPRSEGTHQGETRQHPPTMNALLWLVAERLQMMGWMFVCRPTIGWVENIPTGPDGYVWSASKRELEVGPCDEWEVAVIAAFDRETAPKGAP